MVLDKVCDTIGLEDPDVRDAISTLDDIAKEASGNDKKVKLETRESVPEFTWTASLSCRDAQNEVTIDLYFRHDDNWDNYVINDVTKDLGDDIEGDHMVDENVINGVRRIDL